jgi:hypothetical protein
MNVKQYWAREHLVVLRNEYIYIQGEKQQLKSLPRPISNVKS